MHQILLKDITVHYDDVCVLKNVSFNIDQGDFINIVGPNGGGKTTLLKVILGIIKPTMGKVVYQERLKFGYVPQFSFFERSFPIKVMDVILMGKLNKSFKLFNHYLPEEMLEAEKLMRRLNIAQLKHMQISHLSGGQLQKVLLARAIMTNPHVLVLDEPTANLDTESKGSIQNLFSELHKKITVIEVTHDAYKSTYANKIVKVNKGITLEVRV